MTRGRVVVALLFAAPLLRAQPVQFGVSAGSLRYKEGREEQAVGVIARWRPLEWLDLSATPTSVRVHEPAVSSTVPALNRSGLVDLPLEATVSRGFESPFSPSVAASLGVTLPVGDTANGFGSGEVGSSISGGVGFSPTSSVWVHLGAGRSLTRFSVGSAFGSGTGWGDASAGTSLTDRVSVSAGYSSDLGAVDSALGRSTSLNGGVSVVLHGHTSFDVSASRGLTGAAPTWSIAIGLGTTFPYLNHLGGASTLETLQETFGGGTHGLHSGTAPGNSGSAPGRGRGKKGS